MHRLVSDHLVISTMFRTKFWRSLKAQLRYGLLIGAVSCMQEISFPFQLAFPMLGDPSMIWPFISPLSLHPAVPGGFKEFFPTIQQRNLTIADVPELIAAAEIGGMQITGPPLTDAEVERLKTGGTVELV
jgi:hypothetical protein